MVKKRTIVMVLALAMGLLTGFAGERTRTLKVYNWADYIDMEHVLNTFPAWYEQQTGEEVEVIYQTFDINESMLTQIEVGKEDYDVVCPSEYIIERMLRLHLLQRIQKELVPDSINYFDNVAPFVVDKFQQMAVTPDMKVSDYAVGYMGGTTGWLYNADALAANNIDLDLLKSWAALTNPIFKDHIYVKDAFRDVYSVLVLYAYKEELAEGRVTKEELMREVTLERIARVEAILKEAKDNIAGWEVDFGKEEMTKGRMWLNLSWSGDAQWSIEQAEEMGVKLGYTVPEEGSNLWYDGWVIPIYARNAKAATYFIDYMCKPENAIYNMEEIGYVSVVATPEIFEWANDEEAWPETVDASYLFGDIAKEAHLNPVCYPDITVVEKCGLMHDSGTSTEDLIAMWNRVKGDNLSTGVVIFLVAILLCVLVYGVVLINKNNRKKTKKYRK